MLNLNRRPGIEKIIQQVRKEHPHWTENEVAAKAKQIWFARNRRP